MKAITAIALAATVTALVTGFAAQAMAQDEGPYRAAVSYADLDLASPAGRATLERRVERAVDRVCPARPLPSELDKRATYNTCRKAALTGARQQLAQLYGGRQLAQSAVRVAGN